MECSVEVNREYTLATVASRLVQLPGTRQLTLAGDSGIVGDRRACGHMHRVRAQVQISLQGQKPLVVAKITS